MLTALTIPKGVFRVAGGYMAGSDILIVYVARRPIAPAAGSR